jgi:hypothetical protein
MNQTIQETIKDTDEPVTVKGFRSASGETPNLGLPIVSGTDVYSPLTDWNQSMEKIDSAVGLVELMGSVNKVEIEKIKADNTRQDAELDAIRQVDETQTEWLVDQQGSINKLKVSNDTIEKDIIEQNALIKNLTNRVLEVEDKLDPDSGEVAAEIEANTALIRNHWQGDETVEPRGILNNAELTRAFSLLSGAGSLPIIKKVVQPSSGPVVLRIPNNDLYPPVGITTGRPNLVLVEIFFKRNDLGTNYGEMYGAMVVNRNHLPATITTRDLSNPTTVTNTFSVNLGGNSIDMTAQSKYETDTIYFRLQVLSFLQS